jgi:integration host factor subunit beta
MTKAELVEKLQKGAGKDLSKKELGQLVDELFDHISKSVKKDKRFAYPGFGTFQLRKRAARVGRNPRTGDSVRVDEKHIPFFKTGNQLRDRLNVG